MNGTSRVLEQETNILPVLINAEEKEKIEIATLPRIETGKSRITVAAEMRFARLKKSLRKRSASIL